MASAMSGGYFPQYPHHDDLPDPEIRTFITNFYRTSDRPNANELWVSFFTDDAEVAIGSDAGKGQQEIRELRSRMWTVVQNRKHVVTKVFPARFKLDRAGSDAAVDECELMLFGEVHLEMKDGGAAVVPWAGHAILKKSFGEKEEWKIARYRVWLQRS